MILVTKTKVANYCVIRLLLMILIVWVRSSKFFAIMVKSELSFDIFE